MAYPSGLRYTQQHEWVKVEGDTGTVGITDYAQQELGDVVYVDLPKIGATIKAGESLGTVESVKAVSEIYSPLSGEVIALNDLLQGAPEKINQDPHGEAWLVKLKLSDAKEAASLMDAAAYDAYVSATAKEHSA
ncbi:MAG: glycine cleavage system protein GcvH [Candidatus Acidiferrales bacterium]|jgi:glycine cleavage system H protein